MVKYVNGFWIRNFRSELWLEVSFLGFLLSFSEVGN